MGRKALVMDSQTRKYYDAYNMQRLHAGYRKIDWCFSFEEWLEWWGEDINRRGKRDGELVMARTGDTGPYHPDNVIKKTANENHKEGHVTSNRTKKVMTVQGEFDSLTEASKHLGITVEGVRHRIKSQPTEYYYLG